jgi:hypothetical protein
MRDLHDQADRVGAPASRPEPEREWTDRAALARAVAASKSREEAIAIVAAWDAPEAGKRAPGPADAVTAQGARAVATVAGVCGKAAPWARPAGRAKTIGPLFERGRGGT